MLTNKVKKINHNAPPETQPTKMGVALPGIKMLAEDHNFSGMLIGVACSRHIESR